MTKRPFRRRKLLLERLSERRVLATISGVVFNDANDSYRRDEAESGLASRIVYVDSNDDGMLNADESYDLTDDQGNFALAGLDQGRYAVRVYDGNSTQSVSFPVAAELTGQRLGITSLSSAISRDNKVFAARGEEIYSLDLITGTSRVTTNDLEIEKLQALPGGNLLALTGPADDPGLWIVDPVDDEWQQLRLSGDPTPSPTGPPLWKDIAVDGQGCGLVIGQSPGDDATFLYKIDASAPSSVQLTSLDHEVPAGSAVLSSPSGPRTVLAIPDAGGLVAELWSNQSGSRISTASALIGVSKLQEFDDASGLLIARDQSGGIRVIDVDNDFQPLLQLDQLDGAVRLDAAREMLWAVTSSGSSLSLLDLRTGETLTESPLASSSVGGVSTLLAGQVNATGIDSLAMIGAGGMAEVGVDRADAQRVDVHSNQTAQVNFAMRLRGANAAPVYQALPDLTTREDEALSRPAPGLQTGLTDADDDPVLILQTGPASHAFAVVSIGGGIQYQPNPDFNGTDTVPVLLHDGRDATPVALPIKVLPVPDEPTDLNVHVDPFPEDIEISSAIGTIEVIDVDGNNHAITINDPRFIEVDGQIIYVGGGLDFEQEDLIEIEITAVDVETETRLTEQASLRVTDANDPITGISPELVFAFENAFGDVIAELDVEDQDAEQFYTFTVDDERFIVDENQLRLKPDVALDFESEDRVFLNVTAIDEVNNDSFTQEITVVVRDLIEQPETISLDGNTVVEFTVGATIGRVLIDGVANPNGYTFGTDDVRFEVVDGTLKLVDDAFVEFAAGENIPLQVTGENANAGVNSIVGNFTIVVLENDQPFHNPDLPQDVSHDGNITAQDALLIINYLNVHGPGPVGHGDPAVCYDVNADGFVTALDALLVLNVINREARDGDSSAEGDGGADEATPAPLPNQLRSSSLATDEALRDTPPNNDSVDRIIADGDSEQVQANHRNVVDWVLRQRGQSEEIEAEIETFLRLLSQQR